LEPAGSVADVAGLSVGHWTSSQRPTGCTVVLCPPGGAVCGVSQRGGAPGTRETDLLRPENTVQRAHAVLLTGGSAYGLAAADGVMRWLLAHGRGLPVGPATARPPVRVPIVPAAVLFDLWVREPGETPAPWPDASAGEAACEDALRASRAPSLTPPQEGSIGAGAGATLGKLFGFDRAMRGGLGQAAQRVGGVTVAALVAANPVGEVVDAQGRILAGSRESPQSARIIPIEDRLFGALASAPSTALSGSATTIGVVATDAVLDKAQATQLASLAHAGLARAVRPLTPHDGDTLFALATGTQPGPVDLVALGAAAAWCVATAIRRGVLHASPLASPWVPAACGVAR
jgi:L-aminopeptidase/D-esterase-like protein